MLWFYVYTNPWIRFKIKLINLILSVIPVIPPRARPYVMADNVTCDDDITTQYVEIIKANKNLLDENTNESKREKVLQTLNFRIKTLIRLKVVFEKIN